LGAPDSSLEIQALKMQGLENAGLETHGATPTSQRSIAEDYSWHCLFHRYVLGFCRNIAAAGLLVLDQPANISARDGAMLHIRCVPSTRDQRNGTFYQRH
jgi:hypothetical protein